MQSIFGMQIPIFLRYIISIFLNLKHIQSITTVTQLFQFCLLYIYLLALMLKVKAYVIDST